ncbi:unnamed protein product [Rhizophagus irregularis]|nr:unnamed protein product [Rhizophagus irregularis]
MTALQFFGRGIWQVFFRISGREIVFFSFLDIFFGFWVKVFFGFLGGVKICFYLMAYGSFRLLDLLINSGLWIWSQFQAIWTLKMAFLGPVQSYSIWGFRSLRFKKNRIETGSNRILTGKLCFFRLFFDVGILTKWFLSLRTLQSEMLKDRLHL